MLPPVLVVYPYGAFFMSLACSRLFYWNEMMVYLQLNWKRLSENESVNYVAMTGPLPDLDEWSASVPSELSTKVKQWVPCELAWCRHFLFFLHLIAPATCPWPLWLSPCSFNFWWVSSSAVGGCHLQYFTSGSNCLLYGSHKAHWNSCRSHLFYSKVCLWHLKQRWIHMFMGIPAEQVNAD